MVKKNNQTLHLNREPREQFFSPVTAFNSNTPAFVLLTACVQTIIVAFMRTGLKFKLFFATAILLMTSWANAHFVSGTPDAPAHNLNHLMPLVGLAALAGLIGFATYYCFKRK